MLGGSVICWGSGLYGELGNSASSSSLVPVAVTGLSASVLAIAAGTYHSCAIVGVGNVKCWGRNNFGQLGNNNLGTNSNSPVVVTGL